MTLQFETDAGPLSVTLSRLVVAGWTGRDKDAVQHHIKELAAIGVPAPSQTPLFYAVSPDLATQAGCIAVLGEETSGEVEPLILRADGALWLGIASDHTDRALEGHSVAHSKQICAKPIGPRLWPLAPLATRLDSLVLRCWILTEGERDLYQEGTLVDILPLSTLLDRCPLAEGEAMLCGTLPAIGGIRPAARYEMELSDPAHADQVLGLAYAVKSLPIVS